ncbi:MAG: hypothetical protein IT369_14520 [Candidatus Latescibacteria bacterium]|nr:hypothetical protein [Candidatus Latescibacterota bacterium]
MPTSAYHRPISVRRTLGACLLAWCCLWAGVARAQEVVAVLSSDLAPYREAYQGFAAVLGQPVTQVNLQTGRLRIGRDTRVVVAFGGKAAMEEYPRDLTLIYCMAPGTTLNSDQRQGPTIRVNMLPVAGKVVDALSDLQPSLKHLAVLWVTDTMTHYVDGLQQVAGETGLAIAAEQLRDPDQLPDSLRRLIGRRVEALWVPPDPLLINAGSFAVLREFSRANKIPLYAPTAGFAEEGAVAAVGVSFAQNGRTAAETALAVLAGREVAPEVYPDECEITLNLGAAAEIGLHFSLEIQNRAHKIIP